AVAALARERPSGPPVLLQARELTVPVEAKALQEQFEALSSMPDVEVEYTEQGPIRWVKGDTGVVLPESVRRLDAGASAKFILDAFGAVLLATGSETLTVTQNLSGSPKERMIHTEQSIRGVPVVNGNVALTFDEDTGRVRSISASFLPDRNLPKE